MEPSLSNIGERAWEDSAQDSIIDVLEHHIGLEWRDVNNRISRSIKLRKLGQFELSRDLYFHYSANEGWRCLHEALVFLSRPDFGFLNHLLKFSELTVHLSRLECWYWMILLLYFFGFFCSHWIRVESLLPLYFRNCHLGSMHSTTIALTPSEFRCFFIIASLLDGGRLSVWLTVFYIWCI